MPAPTGQIKIGKDTLVYYSVATTGALSARTWVLYGKIVDCKVKRSLNSVAVEEYDIDIVKYLGGFEDYEITLNVTRRPGLTGFDAMKTKYETRAPLGLAFVTHGSAIDDSGAQGWWGDVELHAWDEDTSKDGITVDLNPKLSAQTAEVPASFTIA